MISFVFSIMLGVMPPMFGASGHCDNPMPGSSCHLLSIRISGTVVPVHQAEINSYLIDPNIDDMYALELKSTVMHTLDAGTTEEKYLILGNINQIMVTFNSRDIALEYPESVIALNWNSVEAKEIVALTTTKNKNRVVVVKNAIKRERTKP